MSSSTSKSSSTGSGVVVVDDAVVDTAAQWRRLNGEAESVTGDWITRFGRPCLSETQRRGRSTVNVALTSAKLVRAFANLLVRDLGGVFAAENVYSSSRIGVEACLERVVNRFGAKTTFVVLGGAGADQQAAKNLDLPFWKVESTSDLVNLKQAMDMQLI